MKKIFIPIFLILQFLYFPITLFSQELIQVTDETITVNSTTSMTGYTRNITSIKLPEKTKKYIYRISVFPKGESEIDNSLFDLLKQYGGANVSVATSFAQFAIKNNDSKSVDAYIFNNTYDADNFYDKQDGNWSTCKNMPNRASCCFATDDCIGKDIYFGFRNNNIMQGLDVKLEVVALIDNSLITDYKYSYSISNSTNQELKFSISLDGKDWQETSLRNGYKQIYTFEQNEVYFRIRTNNSTMALYKLIPNERYKIIWNDELQKWDLTRY